KRPGTGHPQGEALGNQDGSVAVDDQARKPVGLAPDQPAERRRPLGMAARAQAYGGFEPALEEGGVERLVGPGEDPAAEGGLGIVKAAPDEPTARVDHRDRRAGLDVA